MHFDCFSGVTSCRCLAGRAVLGLDAVAREVLNVQHGCSYLQHGTLKLYRMPTKLTFQPTCASVTPQPQKAITVGVKELDNYCSASPLPHRARCFSLLTYVSASNSGKLQQLFTA